MSYTVHKENNKAMELVKIGNVSNDVIKSAIATRFSECYGAMKICNAISGKQTEKWQILHSYTTQEIIDESQKRAIDHTNIYVAIPDNQLVKDSKNYQHWLLQKKAK